MPFEFLDITGTLLDAATVLAPPAPLAAAPGPC